MEQVEITKQQAQLVFFVNQSKYTLSDAFDTGFQNEFDVNGNPEETCDLDMTEEEARDYVVENTRWTLEAREDGVYLCGWNDISGFGFAEERIDYTNDVREILMNVADNMLAVWIDESEENWK